MRYTIPMADLIDGLCSAVDEARRKVDESFMDDAECKRWKGKITDAWEMLLTEADGTPREVITLAVWPNGKTVLELPSRSEAGVIYHSDAKHCQCRGARHVCDHRVAAQVVVRALEAIGASVERQAA